MADVANVADVADVADVTNLAGVAGVAPYLIALLVHGVVGGFDVLVNHELLGKAPRLANSRPEQRLHSARELVFAAIFSALAWYEWHGLLAAVIVLLFVAEVFISTLDTVLEFAIRTLPVPERVAHVVLFINLGVIMTLVGQHLLVWAAQPTALVAVHHGAASWMLSALAGGALLWSVRDALNVWQCRHSV